MARKMESETATPDEAAEILQRAKAGPPQGMTPVSFGPALAKVGDEVHGEYIGPGEDREVKRGKKRDMVKMYRIHDKDRGQIEIMGGAQMDSFFATVKAGQEIWIRREGQGKTSEGNKVNLYSFAIRA